MLETELILDIDKYYIITRCICLFEYFTINIIKYILNNFFFQIKNGPLNKMT